MRSILRSFLCLTSLLLINCKKAGSSSTPPFESLPVLSDVAPGFVDEASGIAESNSYRGYLWVELDNGNPPDLHLLKHDGSHGSTIHLIGATNRDWEDLAVSTGPGTSKKYIYVAEIGDNNLAYSTYSIYRLQEPEPGKDSVSDFDKINFTYPDGRHDAEAILVDAVSRDIYIITKRDQYSKVYMLAYPQSVTSSTQASLVMDLPYRGVVSAAISPQNEILVKTYSSIYYYKGKSGESVKEILSDTPQSLAYQVEAQGEAICFSRNNNGFFTLSEKSFLPAFKLNFYRRN
jgi:hypothetical protein